MKVKNLNVDESRKASWLSSPANENEPKKLPIALAESDVYALQSAKSHYGFSQVDETIRRLIDERGQIDELTLSKQGRNLNHGSIQLDPDVTEEVIKEAGMLGLNVAEYIRGIIYTRSNQLMEERMAGREAEEKRKHDNRHIRFEISIDKDIREKLYKKHGELRDKALIEKAREDILKYLSK